MKEKKEKSQFFKFLVEHISQSWFRLKGYPYPFQGRDFKNLKGYCRSFQEWGVMALWDKYVECDNDWVKKTGYSLGGFYACLPWLTDVSGWKDKAKEYEKKMVSPPIEIQELFALTKIGEGK